MVAMRDGSAPATATATFLASVMNDVEVVVVVAAVVIVITGNEPKRASAMVAMANPYPTENE